MEREDGVERMRECEKERRREKEIEKPARAHICGAIGWSERMEFKG
jgi:hypothetical protein